MKGETLMTLGAIDKVNVEAISNKDCQDLYKFVEKGGDKKQQKKVNTIFQKLGITDMVGG